MVKHRYLPVLVAAVAVVLGAVASPPASADFIRDNSVSQLGQGFGAVPRLLTVQATGNVTEEFACNTFGPAVGCSSADATFNGNGLVNGTEGFDGNVNPGPNSVKNNVVNLSDLGITNATDIRLLYNPSESGANVNPDSDIHDLTLKFYDAQGNLIISVDGGCGPNASCADNATDPLFFADTGTNLGNGGVGFVLKLDSTQAAAINAACGANLAGCTSAAGEATINLTGDGPDSFTMFSRSRIVPEPGSLVLLGSALIGLSGLQWRRRR